MTVMALWKWDLVAILAAVAAGVSYVVLHRGRLGARAAYFAAAVAVFVVALASPVGTLADGYLFSAHMLQHLLLVLVVPPLALLGLPAFPGPSLTLGAGERAMRRFPLLVSWAMGVGAMWLWHAPTLCNAAAQSALVHRVQEATLVAMGIAFFWPVLAPRHDRRAPPLVCVLYLFTACIACTILGIVVTFSPVEVCSVYLHPQDRLGILPTLRDGWGLSPARDQQIGGLLMWVPACLVYLTTIMGSLARFYGEPEVSGEEEAAR
jgi:cytochrome c oxidase assembly factor CtaG